MPRFDLVVEYPDNSGKRVKFHAIGEATGLDHLPEAVATALAVRITQQCGVAVEGVGTPDQEKQFCELLRTIENTHGPANLATKNQLRKTLGLPPLKQGKPAEDKKADDKHGDK